MLPILSTDDDYPPRGNTKMQHFGLHIIHSYTQKVAYAMPTNNQTSIKKSENQI